MSSSVKCHLCYKQIKSSAKLASLTQTISERKQPTILGGNHSETKANRFSVWACRPRETFKFCAGEKHPFGKLEAVLNKYELQENTNELPNEMFKCGWMGYFSYDLGQYIEKVPETADDDLNLPLIELAFYDRAICYDHKEQVWRLVALEIENENADEKFVELEEILKEAEGRQFEVAGMADLGKIELSDFQCNMSEGDYYEALEKTKRYIYDGDVYQINFSQRFSCEFSGDAISLYQWQNEHNASPYAAFIGGEGYAIVSASPELFIRIQDGRISTKPIKGTRPRVSGVGNARQINEANFADLVQSEKDQAELNMIVDLERNDMARICKPGTRYVSQRRTIEEFPTVFHAVATVEGELKNANSRSLVCDVLKAMFPGGSITGAPKIRAMEIIDELEPTQRSVYTGSIGFIGVDKNVCLNIAIRTIIITGGKAYAQTGGGIVADSVAQAEWDETITKARALLAGINAVNKKALNK